MTHAELVARAQRWLRSRKHPVVLAEITLYEREQPDVIAWTNGGVCTLVECKVSRADFLRDRKKTFRASGGMGALRWYATPPGLVRIDELPVRWGLVEVGPRVCRMVVKPIPFGNMERNTRGETRALVSGLRRATESWGRKVFGEISPVHGQLDPHPTVAANLKAYRDEIRSLRAKVARRDEQLAGRTT